VLTRAQAGAHPQMPGPGEGGRPPQRAAALRGRRRIRCSASPGRRAARGDDGRERLASGSGDATRGIDRGRRFRSGALHPGGIPAPSLLGGEVDDPHTQQRLALSIAQHVAATDHRPVVIFSLEMSKMELVQRLMCSEARVDSNRLRRGALQDSDWPKLSLALGRLAEAPIFIDDTPNATIMEMRAKCRRVAPRVGSAS